MVTHWSGGSVVVGALPIHWLHLGFVTGEVFHLKIHGGCTVLPQTFLYSPCKNEKQKTLQCRLDSLGIALYCLDTWFFFFHSFLRSIPCSASHTPPLSQPPQLCYLAFNINLTCCLKISKVCSTFSVRRKRGHDVISKWDMKVFAETPRSLEKIPCNKTGGS